LGLRAFALAGWERGTARRIDALLDRWALAEHRTTNVDQLSHGTQRLLEIALAFATQPRIVMLDEPTAGLSDGERAMVTSRLKELDRDVTLILTDHDMDVVFQLGDQITVLDRGRVIADDNAAEVRRNRQVRDVYLGSI
jgi:branched-chain amino acid transport system ATP-binding protein